MESKTIYLSDIYIPQGVEEGQLRKRSIEEKEVREMAFSLQTKGLQDYLSVSLGNTELGHDKPYEIKNGSGRYHAFLLMSLIAEGEHESVDLGSGMIIDGTYNGEKYDGTLNVFIDNKILTIPERLAVQMTANYNIKKTASKEGIDAMQEILYNNPGMEKEELAKMMGISVEHIKRLFKTVRLPDFAREALQENKITLNNAILLSKVVNKVDDDLFQDAFDKGTKLVEKDFAVEITLLLDVLTTKKIVKNKEFTAKEKYRSKTEALDKLHISLEEYKQTEESGDDLTVIGIKLEITKWFLGLDEASVTEQRQNYEQKKVKQESKKEENTEKRKKLQNFDKFYTLINDGIVNRQAIPKAMRNEYKKYEEERAKTEKQIKSN